MDAEPRERSTIIKACRCWGIDPWMRLRNVLTRQPTVTTRKANGMPLKLGVENRVMGSIWPTSSIAVQAQEAT